VYSGNFTSQAGDNESCNDDFECQSNVCELSGQCKDSSLVDKAVAVINNGLSTVATVINNGISLAQSLFGGSQTTMMSAQPENTSNTSEGSTGNQTTEMSPQPRTSDKCTDPDSNYGTHQRGITSGYRKHKDGHVDSEVTHHYDDCADSKHVWEGYCVPTNDYQYKVTKLNCANGCKDGACLPHRP
jgi:hypothetical protein